MKVILSWRTINESENNILYIIVLIIPVWIC